MWVMPKEPHQLTNTHTHTNRTDKRDSECVCVSMCCIMAARTHLSKCATGEVQKVLHTLQRNELESEKLLCYVLSNARPKKKIRMLPPPPPWRIESFWQFEMVAEKNSDNRKQCWLPTEELVIRKDNKTNRIRTAVRYKSNWVASV